MISYEHSPGLDGRLKFYAYRSGNPHCFLFASWDNQSPGESHSNTVTFQMTSPHAIDTVNTGSFGSASEIVGRTFTINAETKQQSETLAAIQRRLAAIEDGP